MAVAMPGHMENLQRSLIVNSDIFPTDKGLIDALRRPSHFSHKSAGLRTSAKSHAMIRDPLVVARREETIRRLNHQTVLLTASELDLIGVLLERRVASVMIGVGMSIDG